MAELYKMKQSETESNDSYLERFKSHVNTVELANGKGLFCMPIMMEAMDQSNPTEREIYVEEQQRVH